MLSRLAAAIGRRPWRFVAAAVLVLVIAAPVGASVKNLLTPGGFQDPHSQSAAADRAIQRATGAIPDGGVIAVVRLGAPLDSNVARAEVAKVTQAMGRVGGFSRVATYYNTGAAAMVSKSRTSTYVMGMVRAGANERDVVARLDSVLGHDRRVSLGGQPVTKYQLDAIAAKDLGRAEAIAFPVLLLLLLWVFRGAVAAVLPLVVGFASILVASLCLRGLVALTPVSTFALNLATLLGLGLAVDYSLFVVSRFREELPGSYSVQAALVTTLATAGRTVVFSALTVTAALCSLLVFPEQFLYSMGLGGAIVALVAAMISLTLLPAVLALLGHRVNAWSPRAWRRRLASADTAEGGWSALARRVTKRPLPVALSVAVVMVALGAPFTQIRFLLVGSSALPASSSARQVSTALGTQFPPTVERAPIQIVVDASGSARPSEQRADASVLAARVAGLPDARTVGTPTPLGRGTWLVAVQPRSAATSTAAEHLVSQIRDLKTPGTVLVGGTTAVFLDRQASLGHRLPAAVGLLVAATVVLLFFLTGSVVLPLVAIALNALTLSAVFGLLVLLFQDGWMGAILGYVPQPGLESTEPILIFAIVFGLSTDYGVFLFSRIKEAHDHGAAEREAIALGLGRTGRIVTSAALLLCVALGAFATSPLVFVKELGIGAALGVILDATLVRALLVPAAMALLGRRAWWVPETMTRAHRHLALAFRGDHR
ncbi:MAG: MMPL family transporter [Acidimicrobiales bacterium]